MGAGASQQTPSEATATENWSAGCDPTAIPPFSLSTSRHVKSLSPRRHISPLSRRDVSSQRSRKPIQSKFRVHHTYLPPPIAELVDFDGSNKLARDAMVRSQTRIAKRTDIHIDHQQSILAIYHRDQQASVTGRLEDAAGKKVSPHDHFCMLASLLVEAWRFNHDSYQRPCAFRCGELRYGEIHDLLLVPLYHQQRQNFFESLRAIRQDRAERFMRFHFEARRSTEKTFGVAESLPADSREPRSLSQVFALLNNLGRQCASKMSHPHADYYQRCLMSVYRERLFQPCFPLPVAYLSTSKTLGYANGEVPEGEEAAAKQARNPFLPPSSAECEEEEHGENERWATPKEGKAQRTFLTSSLRLLRPLA